jgi:RHS repeat-associated protein
MGEDADGTSAVTKYYTLAGQKVAQHAKSATSFLLSDRLGSAVAVTDASGALVANSQQRYLPFGGELLEADLPTDFGYIGQRNNAEIGLMDYRSRFLSTQIARFTRASPLFGKSKCVPNVLTTYRIVFVKRLFLVSSS